MHKRPDNKWKARTKQAVAKLKQLAEENTPTALIALQLWRTENSVITKAKLLSIALQAPIVPEPLE